MQHHLMRVDGAKRGNCAQGTSSKFSLVRAILLHLARAALLLLIAPGPSLSAESPLPKSRTLLEQRAIELKEEAKQGSAILAELAKLREQVGQATQCAAQQKPAPQPDIDRLGSNLGSAWKQFTAVDSAAVLDSGETEYDSLEKALEEMTFVMSVGEACLQSIPSDRRIGGRLDAVKASPLVTGLVSQYLGTSYKKYAASSLSPFDSESVRGILFSFQGEGWTRQRLSASQITAGEQDISAMVTRAGNLAKDLSDLQSSLKQLTDATDNELALRKKRNEEIDVQLTELDDKLSSVSAATDKQLIVAVYMMIGALLVLFLGIRFLSTDIAKLIVENRSLVEVVSMAFLLLTIIILATGEKMPREAIGTLLGSIAGYIFGRKMTDK